MLDNVIICYFTSTSEDIQTGQLLYVNCFITMGFAIYGNYKRSITKNVFCMLSSKR